MVHSFSKSCTGAVLVVEYKSLELFIHGDVLSLSDIRRATHRQMAGHASCTYRLPHDGYSSVYRTLCDFTHVILMGTFDSVSILGAAFLCTVSSDIVRHENVLILPRLKEKVGGCDCNYYSHFFTKAINIRNIQYI
jgi:hypothetical protein